MDQRIESFLGDVLALAGEEPEAVRDGVRVALAKCEAIFRLQQPKKRMRDQAAHACRALCRARAAEELQRRRGTRIGEHLKLVLKHHRPTRALSLAECRFSELMELFTSGSYTDP